ncbi:hypothetical protein [Pseudomonas putida]|uniref:hypothetical protein n=1 Tax=Pseudomonas putida TaxID=303 RepID=UPI0037F2186C
MATLQNHYETYVQQAGHNAVMKTADWVYEAANGPRLGLLLNRFSDKQLLIFQGFASEWCVNADFTIRMYPAEDHAWLKLEIDRVEANYAAIRGVIRAEVERRGIQPAFLPCSPPETKAFPHEH